MNILRRIYNYFNPEPEEILRRIQIKYKPQTNHIPVFVFKQDPLAGVIDPVDNIINEKPMATKKVVKKAPAKVAKKVVKKVSKKK